MKVYKTQENGAQSFRIVVSKTLVTIYEGDGGGKTYEKEVMKTKYLRIIPGIDNAAKLFGPRYRFKQNGNTVLIQVSKQKYLYVADTGIREWTLPGDQIIKLYSPTGNSMVPYPFAISAKGRVYLMLENAVTTVSKKPKQDYYGEYYGHLKGDLKFEKGTMNIKLLHVSPIWKRWYKVD